MADIQSPFEGRPFEGRPFSNTYSQAIDVEVSVPQPWANPSPAPPPLTTKPSQGAAQPSRAEPAAGFAMPILSRVGGLGERIAPLARPLIWPAVWVSAHFSAWMTVSQLADLGQAGWLLDSRAIGPALIVAVLDIGRRKDRRLLLKLRGLLQSSTLAQPVLERELEACIWASYRWATVQRHLVLTLIGFLIAKVF